MDTWIHIESEEIDHPALLPSNVSWVLDPPPIWNFQFPQWWRFWIFSGVAHSSAHLRYKNFCMNRHFCFVWSVNEIYFSIKVFMKIFCLHIKSMNLKATSGWLEGPLNLVETLCREVQATGRVPQQYAFGRPPIPLDKQVLAFVWFIYS